METLEKLKNEILDAASNQDKGESISLHILTANRKGKNLEFILANGRKIVLKRVASTFPSDLKEGKGITINRQK